MTVICWDGETLAADKQSTNCGFGSKVTKIFRVPGGLVAFCGNEGHAMALLAWFRAGRDPETWPRKGGDDSASAVFVTSEGLFVYSGDDGPYCARRENEFFALGAGRDYALAAMHLGKTAREAVEVACALDITCGQGIDTLELEA
jgi:ATP-dependent protease HslVU (ClpYQ) peptidase subunit